MIENSDIRFVLDIWVDDETDIETILKEALKDVKKSYEKGAGVVGCLGQYRYWLEYPELNDPVRKVTGEEQEQVKQ